MWKTTVFVHRQLYFMAGKNSTTGSFVILLLHLSGMWNVKFIRSNFRSARRNFSILQCARTVACGVLSMQRPRDKEIYQSRY
jgi:hypothetical protein